MIPDALDSVNFTGFEGGLGVVIVAILLDRITQSIGQVGHGEGLIAKVRRLLGGGQPVAEDDKEANTSRAA